jgi:hypothetical protein
VNLLADPERQSAPFFGSRSSPQGARLVSSRFTLLPASRAIHADALGVIVWGRFLYASGRLTATQNGRDARTVYSAYPPVAGLASAVPPPDVPGVAHGSRRLHPEVQAGGEHVHDFQQEAAILK